jgi:hypothetical protein
VPNSSTISADPASLPAPTRRDFLFLAAAGPVDVDLSQLQPGQPALVLWSARPAFVVNRPKAALDALRDRAALSFPQRQDLARRRESPGVELRLRLARAGVKDGAEPAFRGRSFRATPER